MQGFFSKDLNKYFILYTEDTVYDSEDFIHTTIFEYKDDTMPVLARMFRIKDRDPCINILRQEIRIRKNWF